MNTESGDSFGDRDQRAKLLYPSALAQERVAQWSDGDWEHFRQRLFDLSELMRNVQAAFGRWFNRFVKRRGRVWADRFKSLIPGDMRAVIDCMVYIELNALRAGLVERPEDHRPSSLHLREIGQDGWLMPLAELLVIELENEALIDYRGRIYHRGSVPTKEGQAVLSKALLEQEADRGFAVAGVFRKRLRYFVEGLVIGSETMIREHIARLRESGQYLRRKNPIEHLDGLHLSLREQRSNVSPY